MYRLIILLASTFNVVIIKMSAWSILYKYFKNIIDF